MPVAEIDDLRRALVAVADRAKAPAMAAYMQDRFEFLGVSASDRRRADRPFVASGKGVTSAALLDAADRCWDQPEREFQYTGVDLLVRWVASIDAGDLSRVERLIRTKSWWDTVDALAANVVGPMAAAEPALLATIDRWIDDDLWVARSAILHQLTYRDLTDAERLFDYVDRRCADSDVFMRKACGWALRQYAGTDADAVRRYVIDRGDRLSGLTRREALRHIGA